jgi:DNA helicase-2/ATP-dependent DNA helicase PcrA
MSATRMLLETEELKPKQRTTLRALLGQFDLWAERSGSIPHYELAEQILDESGYTAMWQNDKSPDSPGRLENLKELIRSMEEFETLAGFLEHISLVMDRDTGEAEDSVSIMTLHSAKGLEFNTVFLPGWEEGLFPSQRTMDESGRAGLEEERRLAHVGLTRARKRAKIYFATNRRIHGLWSTTVPSRFLDELPEAHVEVTEAAGGGGFGMSGYGASRFDEMTSFGSSYTTPGWQRAQGRRGMGGFDETGQRRYGGDEFDESDRGADRADLSSPSPLRAGSAGAAGRSSKRRTPLTIEGELIAKSTGTVSDFSVGDRVFHQKFGNGNVVAVDGNKLTIAFDKAGEKRVVDSFVERV